MHSEAFLQSTCNDDTAPRKAASLSSCRLDRPYRNGMYRHSEALYHNVEHTMLVTLAGHDILRGRALHAHMPPEDYAHTHHLHA